MSIPIRRAFVVVASFVAMLATVTSSVDGFSTSTSSSPIPPPPPISVPVWSFATTGSSTSTASTTSMNIMTFCTPVSVSTPKLWALSFYHGTLTKDSFLGETVDTTTGDPHTNGRSCSIGVLQLLRFKHRYLVPILGKQSGRDIDKSSLSCEKGFPWLKFSPTGSSGDDDDDDDADDDDDDNTDQSCGPTKSADTENCAFELLPGCALYLQVECPSSKQLIDAGDHVVAICKVTRIGVWEEPSSTSGDNDDDDDEEPLGGGTVRWLDQAIDGNAMPLSLGGIDESIALYSGRLREEGIL